MYMLMLLFPQSKTLDNINFIFNSIFTFVNCCSSYLFYSPEASLDWNSNISYQCWSNKYCTSSKMWEIMMLMIYMPAALVLCKKKADDTVLCIPMKNSEYVLLTTENSASLNLFQSVLMLVNFLNLVFLTLTYCLMYLV